MSDEETFEVGQSFWGIVLKPGEKFTLDPPDEMYTIISNVCFGEFPEKVEEKPTTLSANVETQSIPKDNESESVVTKTSLVIANLIPNRIEQMSISQTFGPLSTVTLENNGQIELHISGYYLPTDEEEEEDIGDEEDFEEEEKNEKKKK